MRITAKTRKLAIWALDIAACNPDLRHDGDGRRIDVYALAGGRWVNDSFRHSAASRLCQEAWRQIPGLDAESLAGAACLLRDGWSPGDPMVDLTIRLD